MYMICAFIYILVLEQIINPENRQLFRSYCKHIVEYDPRSIRYPKETAFRALKCVYLRNHGIGPVLTRQRLPRALTLEQLLQIFNAKDNYDAIKKILQAKEENDMSIDHDNDDAHAHIHTSQSKSIANSRSQFLLQANKILHTHPIDDVDDNFLSEIKRILDTAKEFSVKSHPHWAKILEQILIIIAELIIIAMEEIIILRDIERLLQDSLPSRVSLSIDAEFEIVDVDGSNSSDEQQYMEALPSGTVQVSSNSTSFYITGVETSAPRNFSMALRTAVTDDRWVTADDTDFDLRALQSNRDSSYSKFTLIYSNDEAGAFALRCYGVASADGGDPNKSTTGYLRVDDQLLYADGNIDQALCMYCVCVCFCCTVVYTMYNTVIHDCK